MAVGWRVTGSWQNAQPEIAEHTFTYLSQPDETMIGVFGFGLNLTHDTQSLWPSSWIVYLH